LATYISIFPKITLFSVALSYPQKLKFEYFESQIELFYNCEINVVAFQDDVDKNGNTLEPV